MSEREWVFTATHQRLTVDDPDGTVHRLIVPGEMWTECIEQVELDEGWDTAPFLAPGYNDSNVTYCRLCWPFLAKPADDEPPAEDPGGFAV